VYGPKSIIDGLTELVVEFDVSKIENPGQYEVNLPVPNGVTKLSANNVLVQASVTKEETPVEENETSNGAVTDTNNGIQTPNTEDPNTTNNTETNNSNE